MNFSKKDYISLISKRFFKNVQFFDTIASDGIKVIVPTKLGNLSYDIQDIDVEIDKDATYWDVYNLIYPYILKDVSDEALDKIIKIIISSVQRNWEKS